jgi:DNA repair protein RecO (recombination protein O)
MPLARYTAFVLVRHPLTESSWIVSLFTREAGKVRAVAKGGRQMKSPFRGALETFNRVRVEVSAKEGQDLGNVRVVDLEEGALDLFADWGRSAVLFGALEVLERGLADHSAEEETWRLTASLLEGLRAGVPAPLAWPWFLFWFLRLHGVLVLPRACGSCAAPLGEEPAAAGFYASSLGGWICPACAGRTHGEKAALSPGAGDLLTRFHASPLRAFAGADEPAPALKSLADVVYLATVGFLGRPLKAAGSIRALYDRNESK